jgi:hypothetical protein
VSRFLGRESDSCWTEIFLKVVLNSLSQPTIFAKKANKDLDVYHLLSCLGVVGLSYNDRCGLDELKLSLSRKAIPLIRPLFYYRRVVLWGGQWWLTIIQILLLDSHMYSIPINLFLWVLWFPPPIKLTTWFNWNILESGVKQLKPTNHLCKKSQQGFRCLSPFYNTCMFVRVTIRV